MFQIGDTIISNDLLDEHFFCDLATCRGICCVEGDAGAPLLPEEVPVLEKILPEIWEFLPEKSRQVIEKQGVSYIDDDDEPVTMLVNNCECAFVYKDEDGTAKCAIEKAYRTGKIDFYKPISCHLYPVRLQKYKEFTAVSYHCWNICECARVLGKKEKIPVYQFLKEPLIRRFGVEWYEQLDLVAKEMNDITKNRII
jgi:hypothetical protein